MPTRRTIPRLEALAYAVRSLWGFHVIYGGAGHRDMGMGRSHDIWLVLLISFSNYFSHMALLLYAPEAGLKELWAA